MTVIIFGVIIRGLYQTCFITGGHPGGFPGLEIPEFEPSNACAFEYLWAMPTLLLYHGDMVFSIFGDLQACFRGMFTRYMRGNCV